MDKKLRRYLSPRNTGAAFLYLFAGLGILYRAVDAAGNAEFASKHLGGLDSISSFLFHPGTLLVTLIVATALLLSSGAKAGLPFDLIDMARMKRREKFGVLWRPAIQEDGSVRIGDPVCAEHLTLLKYRDRNFLFGLIPRIATHPPPGLATLSEQVSPPEFSPGAGLQGFMESLRAKPEAKEEPEWKVRDLTDNDRSGIEKGPWCEDCERWITLPKTIGDCKLEVRAEVRDELGL